MKRLDFIAVGPQRTASSWLHLMLLQHPEISLPTQVKETMFWDKRFEKGTGWYEKFFQDGRGGRRRGEIAPTLFPSEPARVRLWQSSPETRIIILVRDPVERAISHYRHERALGLQSGSLQDAVRRDPRILEASRYSKYLPLWIADFGQERIHLVSQESIADRPREVLNELCHFLCIQEQFTFGEIGSKSSLGSTARSPMLASCLYRTACHLRRIHWHGLINLGKRLGIRKLLYSRKLEPLSVADLSFLENTLGRERDFIEGLLDKSG